MRTKKEQEARERERAGYRRPLRPALPIASERRNAVLKLAVVLGIELLIAVAVVAVIVTFTVR